MGTRGCSTRLQLRRVSRAHACWRLGCDAATVGHTQRWRWVMTDARQPATVGMVMDCMIT